MCFPIIYIQKISVFYVINIESYLFDIKIHLVHYFLTAMSFKVVTLSQITILSTILFQVYKFLFDFLILSSISQPSTFFLSIHYISTIYNSIWNFIYKPPTRFNYMSYKNTIRTFLYSSWETMSLYPAKDFSI